MFQFCSQKETRQQAPGNQPKRVPVLLCRAATKLPDFRLEKFHLELEYPKQIIAFHRYR
jgi:hypothetical protein